MKILYFPCHGVLRKDEVTLLQELGHEIIVGERPQKPVDFDICIAVFRLHWLEENYEWLKGHPVFYRTIGQSNTNIEQQLHKWVDRGVKIIRYSPMEQNIPHYAGRCELIRFYKDENYYTGWVGNENTIAHLSKKAKKRPQHCNYPFFLHSTKQFSRVLYGRHNEDVTEVPYRELSIEEFVPTLQQHRCILYTGTFPASYTLGFIETLMMGIPTIAIDSNLFNMSGTRQQFGDIYEVPQILTGYNGFVVNTSEECQAIIQRLFNDYDYASIISSAGRQTAINLFGKQTIKKQWNKLLKNPSVSILH